MFIVVVFTKRLNSMCFYWCCSKEKEWNNDSFISVKAISSASLSCLSSSLIIEWIQGVSNHSAAWEARANQNALEQWLIPWWIKYAEIWFDSPCWQVHSIILREFVRTRRCDNKYDPKSLFCLIKCFNSNGTCVHWRRNGVNRGTDSKYRARENTICEEGNGKSFHRISPKQNSYSCLGLLLCSKGKVERRSLRTATLLKPVLRNFDDIRLV